MGCVKASYTVDAKKNVDYRTPPPAHRARYQIPPKEGATDFQFVGQTVSLQKCL